MSYQEYRNKWDNMPRNFVQERVPVHLDLEITTYCQLQCDFCPRTQLCLKPEHMNLLLAKDIIGEFAEKGGCSIKFVYLGEPCLYPYLLDVIQYAKKQGIVETIIATNGNAMNYRLAQGLVKAGLDYIIFSVDSCHPNTYKRIRKGGELSNVLKSLSYIDLVRDGVLKTQIQCIPLSYNFYEIESGEYEEFFRSFADQVLFSPYCEDYSNLYDIGEVPKFFCTAPFRRMLVRVNGDIAMCCGSRIDSKILGNYKNLSLEDAWNSDYMKHVRNCLEMGKSHDIDACRICPYRKHKEGTKLWEEMRSEIHL